MIYHLLGIVSLNMSSLNPRQSLGPLAQLRSKIDITSNEVNTFICSQ
jgi:hypothetical protein